MKKIKGSEIRDLTDVELLTKSRDLRQELFNLKLQQASGQLEKSASLRTIRRNVARVESQLSAIRNTKA